MGNPPTGPDDDVLAGKLTDARKRLSQLRLPAAENERLHRQFIAICDAMKAPGADGASCLRRLTAFLTTLEEATSRRQGNRNRRDSSPA